jgi:hypothetical protein
VNAHLNRIVEGPLASDTVAANDTEFAPPALSANLTLVFAQDVGSPAKGDIETANATTGAIAENDYVLGGYAGI